LVGCQVPKPKPKNNDGPEVNKEVITNEPVTSTLRDADGKLVWEVRSAATTMVLGQSGTSKAELVGVVGKFYRDGQLASTFESETGHADQNEKVLVLDGNVRVKAEKLSVLQGKSSALGDVTGLLLKADKVIYRQDLKRIEAEGHVTVSSSAYEAGVYDKLWAKPDLRKFGTPDAYMKGAKR
jgi:lipopolysaccharide assembly outer membrane protein LptD (OstA)